MESSTKSEIDSITSTNFVLSCSFAGLITIDTGKPVPSVATCNFVPVTLESVKSDHVAPFLEGIDDESIDIFCRLIFSCLCTDFISSDRILFHVPFCCSSENLRCAVDFEPYLSGMSARLQPVVRTDNIPLIVFLSLHPGLPVFAGFGRCDRTVPLNV